MRLIALACLTTLASSFSSSPAPTRRAAALRLPRCSVRATSFEPAVSSVLATADRFALRRLVRVADHAPAFASLAYFGLISSTQMNMMGGSTSATLVAVITRAVGPTSNAAFSQLFPTLATPANFVFLIWPVITVLQLAALLTSALRPAGPPLRQSELTALTLANCAATAWLILSSNAVAGALPLGSCLVLPLVPLIAAYPLRALAPPRGLYRLAFQVFSSFTTLASILALTIELQFGGRLPLAAPAEAAALVFAALSAAVVSLRRSSLARRSVNVLALTGILTNRLTRGTASPLSPSLWALLGCLGWALKKLKDPIVREADADGYITF